MSEMVLISPSTCYRCIQLLSLKCGGTLKQSVSVMGISQNAKTMKIPFYTLLPKYSFFFGIFGEDVP